MEAFQGVYRSSVVTFWHSQEGRPSVYDSKLSFTGHLELPVVDTYVASKTVYVSNIEAIDWN
jgi:hypothetical protein